jgi:hypothetical protein
VNAPRSRQEALDLLRHLMSMHVTLILNGAGIPQSGLLLERRTDNSTPWQNRGYRAALHIEAAAETQRQFDLVTLGAFRYDKPPQVTVWVSHVAGVEQQLRLPNAAPRMLTGDVMPKYLFPGPTTSPACLGRRSR